MSQINLRGLEASSLSGSLITLLTTSAFHPSTNIMTTSSEPGINLEGDLASVMDDEAFQDVKITCSDGVEVGASRHILAARSATFKAMLYGEMCEAQSGKVVLQEVKSDTLHIVLLFLYTGDIVSAYPLSAESIIETYKAAMFLMLPKLMKLVISQTQVVDSISYASSLLNEAVATVIPTDDTQNLYNTLVKFFFTQALRFGDLNDLSAKAVEVLLTSDQKFKFHTNELILLLCVVDWAWASGANAPPADERHDILKKLARGNTILHTVIELTDENSRKLFMNVSQYINLSLICPHRIVHLVRAIDVLVEDPTQFLVTCQYACVYTRCPPRHPSGFRGIPHYNWDKKKLSSSLKVHKEGAVVKHLVRSTPGVGYSVRSEQPIVMSDGGIFEWDIVIEASGIYNYVSWNAFGLVGEAFDKNSTLLTMNGAWSLQSNGFETTFKRPDSGSKSSTNRYGRPFGTGDILTFHLDRTTRSCAISINGTNYGPIFGELPDKVYPAATAYPQAIYRLKTRVG